MPTSKVAEKKAPVKPTKPSLGAQIDALHALREQLRALQAQEKEVEAKIEDATRLVMDTMKEQGVDKSTGKKASVSISETVVGNVTDWDELWKYIFKSKQTHLLQRRVSDPAIRELFELKGKVPGVVPFTKQKLNLRAVQ